MRMLPLILILACAATSAQTDTITRARDLGIPFPGDVGPWNAITDVSGVTVGHRTLIAGSDTRTGVTVVLPRGNDYDPVYAGWHALNANGELTGLHWVREGGFLEGPVVLTNTHSVGAAHEGTMLWKRDTGYHNGGLAALPVIGETWDGFLNDINALHVRPEHAYEALATARTGPVPEGNVGGGTGMVCFRFKGGIGTASRVLSINGQLYTLGVLVQANFGLREDLVVRGLPLGQQLRNQLLRENPDPAPEAEPEGNSIICIIATDAPLLPHHLNRVAQRGVIGLARTGGLGRNSSGDFFIAFSTANPGAWHQTGLYRAEALPNNAIDPVFAAAAEATEEAILNALVAARTMEGRDGRRVHALPHEMLREAFTTRD